MAGSKIYFASDFHLGVPNKEHSERREREICRWLDHIKPDASDLYLVGDLFDFWYEYKTVIPKGFIRFQGKLAELADAGIQIHIFTGNHDMWMFRYFEEQLGAMMYRKPIIVQFGSKKYFIGHGDGLGPGDFKYKFIKSVFANPLCIWLFHRLHPNFGIGIANNWSRRSAVTNLPADEIYKGDDKEYLNQFIESKLKEEHIDVFIFGHRHLKLDLKVGENSRYINLGAWFKKGQYAVLDGENLQFLDWEFDG